MIKNLSPDRKKGFVFALPMRVAAVVLLLGVSRAFAQVPSSNDALLQKVSAFKQSLQQAPGSGEARILQTPSGHIAYLSLPPGARAPLIGPVAATQTAEGTARIFMAQYQDLFHDGGSAVSYFARKINATGRRNNVKLNQSYRGLPVFGAQVIVQTENGGVSAVVSSLMAVDPVAVNGGVFALSPVVPIERARTLAIYGTNAYGDSIVATTPTLQICDPSLFQQPGAVQLVWAMEVAASSIGGTNGPLREQVLINAVTGEEALRFSLIEFAKNRRIYDANNSWVDPGTLSRSEGEPVIGVAEVNHAFDNLGYLYDFYFSRHARDSFDGAGTTISVTVRYPMNNAIWDLSANRAVFGDGYASADDVVAHELTHGVTASESGLIYYGQSGAINESLSDMWGEWIDQTDGVGNDTPEVKWLIGEDIVGDGAVRNMADPPAFKHPDRMESPLFLYNWLADNGGVHSNSGVGNKLCFLLTDGGTFNGRTATGLGIDKASKLMYEAQTNLLTSSSDYRGFYVALTQAAINLNFSADEKASIDEACKAVEIAPHVPPPPDYIYASDGTADHKVIIRWFVPRGADSYKIYRSTVDDSTSATLIGTATEMVYKDTSVVPGTIYYYWVKSVNSVGDGAFSNSNSGYCDPYIDLGVAVDRPDLVFTTGGDSNWFGQKVTTYVGDSAAQSDDIGNSQETWMQTTVVGPGLLTFDWKVNSEEFHDFLQFYIDGFQQSGSISGSVDWTQMKFNIGSGTHTLKWRYVKDASVGFFGDGGWVDQVTFGSAAPPATPASISATDGAFGDRVQVIWAAASGATTYTLYRRLPNESSPGIVIAETPSLLFSDTAAVPGTVYLYRVAARNSAGISATSPAVVGSRRVIGIALPAALEQPSWNFVLGGSADWYGQSGTAYIGGSAGQSGKIANGQESWMQTTVDGPGILTFDWKVSSELSRDFLQFYIDGALQAGAISGTKDWAQMKFTLAAGSHALKWRYVKDASTSNGSDCGWVDQITLGSLAPPGIPSNFSASDGLFIDRVRISWFAPSGSETYKIYRGAANDFAAAVQIGTASASPFFDTTATTATTYSYWVAAANAAGTGIPGVSDTGYASGLTLAEALDQPSWLFTLGGDADWYGQRTDFVFGGDGAQSAELSSGQECWFETTVEGKGALSFYWAVSSTLNNDFLRFYIDGVLQPGSISGIGAGWNRQYYTMAEGSHTLRWRYSKLSNNFTSSGRAWVDRIVWDKSVPRDVSATDGVYGDKVRIAWTAPDGATSYKIYRNSANASASAVQVGTASASPYSDASAVIGTTYYYWVVANDGASDSNFSEPDTGFRAQIGLAEALDQPDWSFDLGGSAGWRGQTSTSIFGGSAGQSGFIGDNQESSMQTMVAGPATLSFYWRVSSGTVDYLEFYIDGALQTGRISGTVDWTPKSYPLAAGSHTLKWRYVKDHSFSFGSDCGWVDKTVATPVTIPSPPTGVSASDGTFIDKIQVTWTASTGATSYKIYRGDGAGSPSAVQVGTAAGSPFLDASVNPDLPQTYWIKASNIAGDSLFSAPDVGYRRGLVPGMDWTQSTSSAAFSGRYRHSSIAFKSKLWVIGGLGAGGYQNDVWSSADGATWTQRTAAAAFPGRNGATCAVFNDKMWIIGGSDGFGKRNDVWSSTDGVNWTQATAAAAFSPRSLHTTVVFNNKLWVIGGVGASINAAPLNDVWSSSDGATWTQATVSAAFPARSDHTSVVFNNRMWVIAGVSKGLLRNDVWSSTNGVNWTQATAAAAFFARTSHSSAVFNGRMWVIGGYDNIDKRDVWSSTDGANWTQATSAAPFSAREGQTSVAFDNKLWVIGGTSGPDVWYSSGPKNAADIWLGYK